MKINGLTPYRPASAVRRRTGEASSSSGSGFLDFLAETAPADSAAPAAPAAPVSSLDAMLALQEISDDELQRRKAVSQGHDTLDALEQLRMMLLSGHVPGDMLQHIRELVARHQAQAAQDPHLASILADIELRTEVELAKLEMAGKQGYGE